MLDTCLNVLLTELDNYIQAKTGTEAKIIYAHPEEPTNTTKDQIIMSLVDIVKEESGGDVKSYIPQGNGFVAKSSPVNLSLYILFSASFSPKNAFEGLKYLSLVVAFFQHKNYFDATNTPLLKQSALDKLSVSWVDLDQQAKSELWKRMGVHYIPSVLYRVGTIPIEDADDIGIKIPGINDIAIH